MTPTHPEDAVLFLDRNDAEVVLHPFCGGTAAVFSARSPTRDSGNQDAAALIPFDTESGVLVVADGAGGTRGGAQASATTVYELCAALEHAASDSQVLREAVLTGIDGANREIQTLGIGAASTLALVELRSATARTYHVGDSQILVLGQRGRIKLLTTSHSPVGYAVESGLLDEEEAMVHEDRHVISNAVGTDDMRVEMGAEIALAPLDTVLVACDGLFDNLTTDEIVELLRKGDLGESTRALVEECRARMTGASGNHSKPDDLTVIAFRLDAEDPGDQG
jgi:serine/threonine protein phosphatase PrpC